MNINQEPVRAGSIFDAFTASAVNAVYEALSPKNRAYIEKVLQTYKDKIAILDRI